MSDEEEEKEMATLTRDNLYTLNESQVLELLNTSFNKVKEHSVTYDINLPKEERISNAKDILRSRKCK